MRIESMSASPKTIPGPTGTKLLPPLEPGDRLTRAEFEQRYEAMPHLKKAELIEGVVYMPSPVSHRKHARPQVHIISWLGMYEAHTPGVEAGDNATVRLDLDNELQPDGLLRIVSARGGQSRLDAKGYIEGPPELVAEVAATTASYDLHAKLAVFCRNGVREYLVWRVLDEAVDWFVLREGRFDPLPASPDGILRSEVFPGLWLEPAALVRGDLARVLEVLGQGLASPEHAAFVQQLARR